MLTNKLNVHKESSPGGNAQEPEHSLVVPDEDAGTKWNRNALVL